VKALVRRPGHDSPGVESVAVGDFTDIIDWTPHVVGVTTIVHLAARTHVLDDHAADPMAAYRHINVGVTGRLLEAAAASGVKRFVLMSSVKAAGESSGLHPLAETMPAAPLDAYGVTKLEAEAIARDIAPQAGMDLVILRPPLVYGPGVRGNFLRLLKLVECGIPLPFGSVKNRRSLIGVGNLVHAVVHAVQHPRGASGTYFVADPTSVSVPELIRSMASALGVCPRLVPVPPALLMAAARITGRIDEARRLIGTLEVDTTLIRNRLGWIPPYTLADGLKDTAGWYHAARSLSSHS
jgi:nucleoside-diphosphate-sugar epimerase